MATSSETSNSGINEKTLNGVGSLIKLLPTGTVFVFQFLSPILTNTGQCSRTNKILSSVFLGLCGLSCIFSSFTDSYTSDGKTRYGIATLTGLWPSSSPGVDFSKYKLRFSDFVHGFLSLVVFGVLTLLDGNMVRCFYPSFESSEKMLLMALPPVIGTCSGSIFVMFPNTRHGIGYPHTATATATVTATATSTTRESSIQMSGDGKTTEGSEV